MEALAPPRIDGDGTEAACWDAFLRELAPPPLKRVRAGLGARRLVVVAPHPDDEVLAAGGLISEATRRGRPVCVIALTGGEACYPASARWSRQAIATMRSAERLQGLDRLGLAESDCVELGLPDGGLVDREAEVLGALRGLLQPGDEVFVTWREDGHPDHEAAGRAVAQACAAARAACHEVPVWMWQWARPGDARVPWHRLRSMPLGEADLACKREALGAHRSQWIGPGDVAPVLRQGWLPYWLRPCEYAFEQAFDDAFDGTFDGALEKEAGRG